MNASRAARGCLMVPAALVALATAAWAQKPPTPDSYDALYQHYLRSARTMDTGGPGASVAWMSALTTDPRARALNDLVTVRVVESISAVGTADASLSKKGAGSASVTKLFGLEGKLPGFIDPTSLAGAGSNTSFEGGGSTIRTGELTATITARVAEVLPNGDLVLEGAREIDINGDRQIVVLTGVVRPVDITPRNVILSSQIGQLSIRYFGRGLMRDNLKPGWLIRVLNKIF
ncbi:MAG TPA: flagellar basal body L-ring protein FlgH [Vicinamibacterales bacterium]|nr:flagellar basal body L-ring protein FlgH [Vicinamibacterales bacterium]